MQPADMTAVLIEGEAVGEKIALQPAFHPVAQAVEGKHELPALDPAVADLSDGMREIADAAVIQHHRLPPDAFGFCDVAADDIAFKERRTRPRDVVLVGRLETGRAAIAGVVDELLAT